jgi:predicted DNA binding protein
MAVRLNLVDYPLFSYILEVEHPSDWTFKTKASTLLVHELFSEDCPQMDRLVEFFVARFSKRTDVDRLMRAIRSQETDELVAPHDPSSQFMKNCTLFGIVGDSHSSIRHVIHRHDGFAPYLTVANGIESWHFYSTHNSPRDILEDLPKECKARAGRAPLSPKSHFGEQMMLNHSRVALLRTALAKGYFDYPRRISLTDLALEFGVRKSSLSQSLRRALKEVLTETIMHDS